MAIQIQLRRDTAANWASANPVLAQSEIGVEIDTDKAKIGDGATAWTALSYWIDESVSLTGDNEWTGEQTFHETKEAVYTLTGTDIDPANGSIQTKTLSSTVTLTESLEPGQSVLLTLIGADAHLPTWPTTKWYGGKPGDFAADLTGDDVFACWKDATGFCAAYIGGHSA